MLSAGCLRINEHHAANTHAVSKHAGLHALAFCATRCSGPKEAGRPFTALVPAVVPKEFEGLELGPLLGKGSYGRVYRGAYHGEEVAVKVGPRRESARQLCGLQHLPAGA